MARPVSSSTAPKATSSAETFEANRRQTLKRMGKQHKGKWIALSADGSQIVESHRILGRLAQELRENGIEIADVSVERLDEAGGVDLSSGGADLL